MVQNRAVFLDRDGVLIRDVVLLGEIADVEILDGVPLALRRLKDAGFLLVVVTNQTVVARGLADEEKIESIHEHIQSCIVSGGGGEIDRFCFCPHHPHATLEKYRTKCTCRKPAPGMLTAAAKEMDIDLTKSYMLGDRISDIAAGKSAGCKTFLLKTGMHTEPPIISHIDIDSDLEPDYTVDCIARAVDIIVQNVQLDAEEKS